MRINRPLVNPLPEDFQQQDQFEDSSNFEEQLAIQQVNRDQISFELDDGLSGIQRFISGTKIKLKQRSRYLEVSGIWKNPSLPFAIVTMLFTTMIILIGSIFEFNNIPVRIPFFFNYSEGTWDQIDKSILFLFPIVYIVLESIVIYIIMNIFEFDKRLAHTMSWIATILNVLLLITVAQFYFLVT